MSFFWRLLYSSIKLTGVPSVTLVAVLRAPLHARDLEPMNPAIQLAQLGQPTLVALLEASLVTRTLAGVLSHLQGAVLPLVTIPLHVLVRTNPATIEGLESFSFRQ